MLNNQNAHSMSNLKSLISRLNPTCRSATEAAANLCMSRTHYEVDLEHLLVKLLEQDSNDVNRLLHHYGISGSHLEKDLFAEMDSFKTGNTRTPVLSTRLPKLFEQAWLLASVEKQVTRIRSGHLLQALLTDPELAQIAHRTSSQFGRISLDELKHSLDRLTADSPESADGESLAGVTMAEEVSPAPQGKLGKTPALDQYTVNLTQAARDGRLDPVLERDKEIRQMIDILTRRRQNNPILTGEAGVGKTAVAEGLALRIAAGDVPEVLRNVALHVLDLGLLQAGASVKGEFENRLKGVIDEVKRSPHPIVLFIDEAHTMIGAGGQAGQNDAANLLKPALARGELRTIAATTWSEYKKYFEKDAALARRFQVIKVDEPSEAQASNMIRGLVHKMEAHFGVRVLDEAATEAVRLSHRYISGRQLPDKAISVLDTACARVALGQNATPKAIEEGRRRIETIEREQRVLEKEQAAGTSHEKRLAELQAEHGEVRKTLQENEARWVTEKELVARIRTLRSQLEGHGGIGKPASAGRKGRASPAGTDNPGLPAKERKAMLAELDKLRLALETLQGEHPLVSVFVDGQTIGEVVSGWTGIPLGKMIKDEIKTVLNLKPLLGERVIGQSHALEAIAQRVRTARANLEDPNKPKGVFLLVGPSGVGKTETALALADILYGGERNMITINMSEYQEAHTVSGLKGSPPGYIGYGEGGVLTEAVRRKPYSVVLLDEVEKAHPDVMELFFQVFDKGFMDDAEGREVDFRNTIIILTSNVGTDTVMRACRKEGQSPEVDALVQMLRPELQKVFKPAFLGRLKVVPYYPISDETMRGIIELKLSRVKRRIAENHHAVFSYDSSLVAAIAARCTEVDSGARNVDHILNGTLLPEIAEAVLARMAAGEAVEKITVGVTRSGGFKYRIV
jgi:type VI secretion system protein VasG